MWWICVCVYRELGKLATDSRLAPIMAVNARSLQDLRLKTKTVKVLGALAYIRM